MTKEQKMLITETMTEYINTVNGLVSDATNGISIAKYTSKDVNANLPSALINQCIRDAKSINRKHKKACLAAAAGRDALKCKNPDAAIKEPVVPVLKNPFVILTIRISRYMTIVLNSRFWLTVNQGGFLSEQK